MDSLFEKWKQYEDECQKNMSRDPASTELVCNRTFDNFACWPDALPNMTVSVSCPSFLPWYMKVQNRHAYKRCGHDGQWLPKLNGQDKRDATECEMNTDELQAQEQFAQTFEHFKVAYTVGYSMSLGTLILALSILAGFSKLHCMRNYIHMNLFASFIVKSSSVLVIDALLKTRYNQNIDDASAVQLWLNSDAVAGCRAASVLMHYGIVANYCWLLVEGIYLHNLLVMAVFSEKRHFTFYVCIGWGAPVIFIIPWVAVKYTNENILCWSTNNHMGFWWIIRSPVLLSILMNFVIFIRIIHILVSKLRAHQMQYTDSKFRLAKSTLTLISLLGTHEVIFAFLLEEHVQGTMRYVKLFFDLFFSSFQGMLVAILYCFVNKEVHCELLKIWRRWKMGKDIEEAYKLTYSQTTNCRTGNDTTDEQHRLVNSNGTGASSGAHYLQAAGLSGTTGHITRTGLHPCCDFPDTAESNL
ncbi:glucagon receptor isoform X3 [Rhinatrema bivittatum]|nr:glucagon receptor isoform X3 [Rhinatrema bivittatum]